MKGALVILLLCTAYTASAVPIEESSRDDYPRLIQYPDGDDAVHDNDLELAPDAELLSEVARNPASNLYLLYTRRNPGAAQTLVMNNVNSIYSSHFDPRVPTVVIAHGWLAHQNSDLVIIIRDAVLARSNVNVIVLGWLRLALSDYVTATNGVPAVGRGLGQFLAFLNAATGAPYASMHLIGFCMGAHLVGNAGREVGGKIGRITGLDPAEALWSFNPYRLRHADAIYVEVIHTNGGLTGLGIGMAIGDADFFPNGGISQPGCFTNICNHNRAWELFAASVLHSHLVARECTSALQTTLNVCRGRAFPMGNNDFNKWGTGTYYLDTGRSYPF